MYQTELCIKTKISFCKYIWNSILAIFLCFFVYFETYLQMYLNIFICIFCPMSLTGLLSMRNLIDLICDSRLCFFPKNKGSSRFSQWCHRRTYFCSQRSFQWTHIYVELFNNLKNPNGKVHWTLKILRCQ